MIPQSKRPSSTLTMPSNHAKPSPCCRHSIRRSSLLRRKSMDRIVLRSHVLPGTQSMHGNSLSRMWARLVGPRKPACVSRILKDQWSLKLVLCYPEKNSRCLAETKRYKHRREMDNISLSSPLGTARRVTR